MISFILTGHGAFAPGLYDSLQMIAGEQEHVAVVPFLESQPLAEYEQSLNESASRLLEESEGVVILTDLLGGTPFRTAMVASQALPNTAVITGTNLPLLIEGSLLRLQAQDAKVLAQQLVATGLEGLQVVEFPLSQPDTKLLEEEDGI